MSGSRWVLLANAAEIARGESREIVVADRVLAVYHSEEGYFALDGVCPHQGGPLGKGALRGSIVTCPWHGWQFDVRTGQHCLSSTVRQPAFAVEQRGDQLWVELPDTPA